MTTVLLPGRRAVRWMDAFAGVGFAVFVVLGILTGIQLTRLAELGTALQDAATALERTGSALSAIARVPLVGGQVSGLADSVVTTAGSVRSGGEQAVAAVQVLAILIGIAVALLPLPVLMAYLPFRISRARAIRELRRSVASPDGAEPVLLAQLAHRTLVCLPLRQLLLASGDPWGDLVAGRHQRLAAAELARLGLTPPADWTTPGSTRR